MCVCIKTFSLLSRDCCKDQVSQPQRRRFIGIAQNSKYLLQVLRFDLLHISLSAPMDHIGSR